MDAAFWWKTFAWSLKTSSESSLCVNFSCCILARNMSGGSGTEFFVLDPQRRPFLLGAALAPFLVGRLVRLELRDLYIHHLLIFLPVNEDLGSVGCHAAFSHALRSQPLDPMDFHGIVRVQDKNVAKRPPEESLLFFVSGVFDATKRSRRRSKRLNPAVGDGTPPRCLSAGTWRVAGSWCETNRCCDLQIYP